MNLLDTASLVVTPNGYKASKLYSIIPSDGTGDMTFERSTGTATRVNPSGLIEVDAANIPRLDYTGGGCPKLLLEPQRTNILTYSEDISQNGFSGVTITNNSIASPDGTTNADSIVETASTGLHVVYRYSISVTNGASYTYSGFFKKGTRDWMQLNLNDGITSAVYFNLNTGVIGNITGSLIPTITSYGNGWYRCSVTKTVASATVGIEILGASANGTASYAGVGGNVALYAFGLQLEAGAYATSYIPTTTASVTRNGDVFYKAGISSLIGQTEGTFFAHLNLRTSSATGSSRLSLSSNSVDNWVFIGNESNKIRIYLRSNNSVIISEERNSTGSDKIAIAYKSGNSVIYINGVQVFTDSSSFTFSTSVQSFVYQSYNGSAGDDTVLFNSAALWKTRLQNSELATLTSL